MTDKLSPLEIYSISEGSNIYNELSAYSSAIEDFAEDADALLREIIITTAQEYIGQVRYRRGGVSLETGVDCVGFVRAIYRLYGIDLPAGLRKQGVHISYSNAQAGDIICYPKHYGIYIGGGKMVHATSGKGVSIGSVNLKKLTDVRRIVTE